ncbi:copper homeostasis protein CutC [Jidongwangia harbinensis]|uniref:copper homeostasis protein CutC n=1 Tax=Jidongwangia harbinensis TaxID=2878561 RepID=UPI001CD99F12|nr:copper homeostasis protein CutC [Jidongwangia harbinensis]MCA2218116.1 copper homeostasis protein CutC [Jidongwangia harbinensis]
MTAFELAVQDTDGLAVAARLGVDRIELCSALPLGGVTPSLALIEAAVTHPRMPPVHVLIRPRPGGFGYSADETALLLRDIRHAVTAGAAGVVLGGLRDGRVDTDLTLRAVDAAAGATVTFHRAFDLLPDPEEGIGILAGLGVHRILTAGGPTTVADGLPGLARLVRAAAGRIEIMAGGGVRPDLVGDLVRTGVAAIHASAKRTVPDPVAVELGTAAGAGVTGRETTDEAEAERILAALR